MTNGPTLPDVHELARAEGTCASIYAPIASTGDDRLQNPVRLKNLRDRAKLWLEQAGVRGTDAERMLEPVGRLIEDPDLARNGPGLAVFIAPRALEHLFLPFDVPELVVVGQKFHIRPLLPVLRNRMCYVLAIAETSARLYEVNGQHVQEVSVPGMPRSREDALGPEYSEKQRQLHSVGPRGQFGSASHGAGDRGADEKNKDLRYCQAVDRALTAFLGDSAAPLILACDEPLLSIYRHASHYAHVADEAIEGAPIRVSAEDLARRAAEIMERREAERVQRALKEFEDLEGSGQTARGAEAIIRYARLGEVARLFLDRSAVVWGRIAEDGTPTAVAEPESGAEDLLNRAAIETLLHGGEVFEVEKSELPPHVAAVATLRY